MENIISIIPALMVIIVGSSFAYFYFGGKRKAAVESGLTPIFEEQAGGLFNGFNLTIPFVRHAIYDDFVVISYGKTKHILKLNEICEVSNKRYIFSKGLAYKHNRTDIPAECVVWSINATKVIEILRSKGVHVQVKA